MPKILLISFEFPPVVGGAGSVGFDYAQFLHQEGWDVTVLTHFDRRRKEDSFDFSVVQVKSPPKVQPFYFYRNFLRIHKGDVYERIILNDAGACLMASMFFSRDLMAKSLVFLHGTEDEKLFHNKSLMFRMLQIKAKYTRLLQSCVHIIAVSHFLKRKFLAKTSLEFLTSKISVIKNSIRLPGLAKLNPPAELNHQGETVLFSACRLVERKGLGKMLHIFRDILRHDIKFVWYIAGEGPYKSQLIELIEKFHLTGHVKLLGSIPKDDMWDYYAFSDCFWLLTDFEEGLGLVFLESALMGCPVITHKKGGVVEVVNEKTGFLITDDTEAKDIILSRRFHDLDRAEIQQEAEIINQDERSRILQWL